MKLSKEELIEYVKGYIGDNTDDKSIELLENITDSVEDVSEDWERKYKELDNEWRKKYIERFSGGSETIDSVSDVETETETEETPTKYNELFEEKESD